MFIFEIKSDDDLRVEKGNNMRRDERKKRKGEIILHTNKNTIILIQYKIIQKYNYYVKLNFLIFTLNGWK